MKKVLLLLLCTIGLQTMAQDKMRISLNDGTQMVFCVSNIKDFTFYTPAPLNIVDEWVSYSSGIMQIYKFYEDGTMKYGMYGVNYYYEYDGTYTLEDKTIKYMLPAMGMSFNLEVLEYDDNNILCTSDYSLHRVQLNYTLTTNDKPITVGSETDVVIGVDGYVTGVENNLITPLRAGTGYALVENSETGIFKACKIDVEYAPAALVDWTKYFKKTREEIINEFGDPDDPSEDGTKYTYSYYNIDIQYILFSFDESTGKVSQISVYFYDDVNRQGYCDFIAENYFMDSNSGSELSVKYYDTDSSETATTKITVYNTETTGLCTILYTDMTE